VDHRDLPALHAYAEEIARELGAPWRYDYKASRDAHGDLWHCAALLTDLSDHGVNVRVDHRRHDRLEITGRLPAKDRQGNYHDTWSVYDGKRPAITVALSRGPGAAARNIWSRLLPIYEPAYAKARGRIDKANDDLDEMQRVINLLSPYGRLGDGKRYGGVSDGRFYLHQGGQARISAYTGMVELRLDVKAELAVKVLQVVDRARAADARED
jgi:hypothetical protein